MDIQVGTQAKTRFSIHEVAELLGISTDAIRLYEKEGLVTAGRREDNGYRYYTASHIHRILGISLYRKIDISIADIKKLSQVSDFTQMRQAFAQHVSDMEEQIAELQRQVEKQKFMMAHLESVAQGLNRVSIKTIPERYVFFENAQGIKDYKDMKDILSTVLFSFGNFCYRIEKKEDGYRPVNLQFIIRDAMIDVCPVPLEREALPMLPAQECVYTVVTAPEDGAFELRPEYINTYLQEHKLEVEDYFYCFYVYSLATEQGIEDYYEIYQPIKGL